MSVSVKDYMVLSMNSVCDTDTLEFTINCMQRSGMSILPVVDFENSYLGSIYSNDILKNILPEEYGYIETVQLLYETNQAAANLKDIKDKVVSDYMSRSAAAIKDTDNMDHVAEVMLGNKQSYVFVTNQAGKLRGYIDRKDLLYYLLIVGE